MTWILITGIILVALGSYTAGVASADPARGLWWALADRVRALRGPAPVYVPVAVPSSLLSQEETVAHADAMFAATEEFLPPPPAAEPITTPMLLRADLPVQRVRAAADPFTGPMPKLTDERYEELRAGRPPSMAELRRQYDSWQETAYAQVPAPAGLFPCCKHCEGGVCDTPHHVACIDCQPVPAFGVDRCEADVLAEQRAATGPERVLQ